jgi:hypothetical protein
MLALVDWVRRETDATGRILLEDQLRLLETTDPESVHWTPLMPVLLGADRRAFVGGLYHGAFIVHHEATSCGDFHLAGRPFTDWTPPELEAYFDRYNIGWAVVWSPVARFVLDQFPGAVRVGPLPRHSTPGRPTPAPEAQWEAIARRAGGGLAQRYLLEGASNYALYRLNRTRQFALAGSVGGMSGRPDRVDLTDVHPDSEGSVLLSLHWIPGLRTQPSCPLGPTTLPGDPAPLVRIRPAQVLPRLVISNGPARD